MLASSGPEDLVAGYSRLRRVRGKTGWQPGRAAAASRFGVRLCVLVGGARVRTAGPWAPFSCYQTFGPIAAFLMDPNGLEETGEVLVGVAEGESDPAHLALPAGVTRV